MEERPELSKSIWTRALFLFRLVVRLVASRLTSLRDRTSSTKTTRNTPSRRLRSMTFKLLCDLKRSLSVRKLMMTCWRTSLIPTDPRLQLVKRCDDPHERKRRLLFSTRTLKEQLKLKGSRLALQRLAPREQVPRELVHLWADARRLRRRLPEKERVAGKILYRRSTLCHGFRHRNHWLSGLQHLLRLPRSCQAN